MTEPQNQEQPTPENDSKTTPGATELQTTPAARYTDKDVDKLKGDARREAKKVARTEREQEILEATGAESVDEVLEAYKAWRAVEEETATETDKERNAREKAEKERDEAKQAANDALKHANAILIRSELKASLMSEGARQDRLARLLKEADLSQVEVEEDEVKNLEPVIKLLKEEIPEWFGSDEQPVGSRPSSRPAAPPTNQQIDKEAQQAERSRTVSAL